MRHGPVVRGCRAVIRRCLIAAILAAALPAEAAPPAVLLPLRLPITGIRDTQVQAAILRRLDRLTARPQERGVLVLEFVPPDAAAGGGVGGAGAGDFGRSLELARFLADPRLAGVKTVAYLPRGAAGHAVLVALACEEIVMAADAVLGPVRADDVDDAMRGAYAQIAARRRTVPPAVALGMLDPDARVVRVSTDAGEQFVAPAEVAGLGAKGVVLGVEEMGPAPLTISGRLGRELGFVRLLARTPAELARGLGVAEGDVVADPALDGGWRAAMVAVDGVVTADSAARARSRMDRAVAAGANLLVVRIDSAGGSPEQSLVLANWLAALDPTAVRTVAWVPREARGDAALVALACDELAMQEEAVLGGPGAASLTDAQAEAVAAAWRAGARLRDRPWSLPAAVALPGFVVHRAVEQGSGRVAYLTAEELKERPDRLGWIVGDPVGTGPIRLDAQRAAELGLAAHVVEDVDGLQRAYGLTADLAPERSGWAEELLAALASPELAWLLLLIGGAGLFIEIKTAGFGFGGFVAMVAFIVYFWSQYLNGTSGWLEVLLFLAGLVCLAAEILVLPGFGVLGLGGGLLVIASIVLASQSFVLPVNDYQIRRMQWSLLGVLAAFAGVAALAVVLRRWLPATSFLGRVLPAGPPAPAADFGDEPRADMVGREGIATTRLAPAGKARIGGGVHDVTADGDLVEPGARVRVVDVRRGRIIVRPV